MSMEPQSRTFGVVGWVLLGASGKSPRRSAESSRRRQGHSRRSARPSTPGVSRKVAHDIGEILREDGHVERTRTHPWECENAAYEQRKMAVHCGDSAQDALSVGV